MATTELDLTAFGVSAENPINLDMDELPNNFALQAQTVGCHCHDMAVLLPKHEMLSVAARLDASAPIIAKADLAVPGLTEPA